MEMDLKILDLMEENANLSAKDIAKMLDISEKKVSLSIKNLRKKGVILKSKTIIDWKKAGKRYARGAIQVKVVPQQRAGFARICESIAKDPRVTDVFVATGEYDILVFIRTETLDEISDFVTDTLAPKKEVVGTYTHIILSEFKRDGAILSNDRAKRLLVSI